MCALTCEPSPSVNRPPVSACRSQALCATVIGDRANATAIEVPNSSPGAPPTARASSRNGSWVSSEACTPSYPLACAAAASTGASPSPPRNSESIFTGAALLARGPAAANWSALAV